MVKQKTNFTKQLQKFQHTERLLWNALALQIKKTRAGNSNHFHRLDDTAVSWNGYGE
ncbi:MAG: hypothetical protein WD361_14980 [Gracilimonas sp.]